MDEILEWEMMILSSSSIYWKFIQPTGKTEKVCQRKLGKSPVSLNKINELIQQPVNWIGWVGSAFLKVYD